MVVAVVRFPTTVHQACAGHKFFPGALPLLVLAPVIVPLNGLLRLWILDFDFCWKGLMTDKPILGYRVHHDESFAFVAHNHFVFGGWVKPIPSVVVLMAVAFIKPHKDRFFILKLECSIQLHEIIKQLFLGFFGIFIMALVNQPKPDPAELLANCIPDDMRWILHFECVS